MRTELISIASDTTPLDGAYYEPEGGATAGAVMIMHGNTMNFYMGAPRFLPPALVELGFACLAFNRRGRDILGIRDSRATEGAAYQLTSEAIADNQFAAEWLAKKGFENPIVIGHSNGGMLAVKHVADHPDTPALILLSAHEGGKNVVPNACQVGLLAGDQLAEITDQAGQLVKAGKGRELLHLPGWWYVVSAESFLDLLNELPNILELAPRITCPVLYLRGDREPPQLYPAEDFKQHAAGPCQIEIIPECDHFYVGREDAVAETVASWLAGLPGG